MTVAVSGPVDHQRRYGALVQVQDQSQTRLPTGDPGVPPGRPSPNGAAEWFIRRQGWP